MLREDREYSLNDYKLKPKQNEIVHFMLSRFSCLNNSQAGAGKTLVSLTAAQHCVNHSKTLQVLIVCPKAALSSFKKELNTKLNQPYSIYTATEYNVTEGSRYHLFCYSKLSYLEEWIKAHEGVPKILICDEAHKLNSTKTNTYKIMRGIRSQINIVYSLTATPLMNDLTELYHVINFTVPGFLGSYAQFEKNYLITQVVNKYFYGRKVKKKEVVGHKNLDHLSKRLDSIILGNKNKYNLDFQYKSIYLSEEEIDSYIKCAEGLETDLGEEKALSARLHDLQKVVDGSHPEFSKPYLSSKEKLLVTCISEIIQRNESVLIYTEYMDSFNRIVKVLESSKTYLNYDRLHFINGSIKLNERVKIENDMPKRSIVIITKAGTASINLQAANNLIFYNIPWSTGDTIQAIGRITRMDTEYDTQHVYFLEAIDTIDTYRRKTVESKVDLITMIFGEQSTFPTIDDDPIDLNKLKRYLLWKKGSKRVK